MNWGTHNNNWGGGGRIEIPSSKHTGDILKGFCTLLACVFVDVRLNPGHPCTAVPLSGGFAEFLSKTWRLLVVHVYTLCLKKVYHPTANDDFNSRWLGGIHFETQCI